MRLEILRSVPPFTYILIVYNLKRTSRPATAQHNSICIAAMNIHPVLNLLAKEEEPPYRVLQKTAALVAESPDVLLDLMGQDLSDDLRLARNKNCPFQQDFP